MYIYALVSSGFRSNFFAHPITWTEKNKEVSSFQRSSGVVTLVVPHPQLAQVQAGASSLSYQPAPSAKRIKP